MVLGVPLVDFLVVVALIAFVVFKFGNGKGKRLPPGPTPIPFLGNVLQLDGGKPYLTFIKWAKTYGPIVAMKMGMSNTIVINDYKLMKELFAENVSTGRSTSPILLQFTKGFHGIVNTDGPTWEAHRRFTLRTLRDFGFAKTSMEVMIMEEVRAVIQHFGEKKGASIVGNRFFNAPVVNSLWHIVTGKRTEWEASGKRPKILDVADRFFECLMRVSSNGLFFAPFVRHIAPGMSGWKQYCESVDALQEILIETIEEHKANLDLDHPQDFIDFMLKEISEATDPNSTFYKELGYKNLIASLIDFFLAGSETSSHTLAWSMLYLGAHPKIQEKVQEEIERVIGSSRLPSLSDKPNMPYTEAVLNETLRISSVVPLGVPHRMMGDKEFHGHLLPKDAMVMVNHHWIMRDPAVWGDGDVFRPERFLNADHTKFQKHEALVPFSVGRRVCIGEGLARDTHFLFVTSILQNFNISPDPSCPNSQFNAEDGLGRTPSAFKFFAKARNE